VQSVEHDLPGFGHSDRNDEQLTPEGTVRCVDSVVHALHLKRIDLLGHSSGAALAILFAAERPELVRRMVLVAVVGVLRPETLLRSQLHEHLNDLREDRPRAAKMVERSGDALVNSLAAILPSAQAISDSGMTGKSPSILLATSLLDYNFAPAIAAVRAPSLLVWGEKDDVAPVRVGHFLDDRLPRSELRFIRDGGHVLMDDQPALLVQTVNDYLDEPLKPEPPAAGEDESQKVARCQGQKDWTLTGDFDEIWVDHCEHAWLNRVRARRIVVRDSDLRIDHASVSEGVSADDSRLLITGGEFHGDLALDLDGGSHDIAGAVVTGGEAAVRARKRAAVLFSVTRLQSKRGTRFAHEAVTLRDGEEL
jgi:pimeloyl-ACP methyl ester carboxylesterase